MKDGQLESFNKLDRTTRYKLILDKLRQFPDGLTARELAYELGFTERNAVAPRINELEHLGMIKEFGRKLDNVTKIRVTNYVLLNNNDQIRMEVS
jgi:DNA-binding Lrp family transcriptional regulator